MVTKPAGFRQNAENMGIDAARLVTHRITASLKHGYDDVLPEILAAFRGRAWVALGFTSWESYCGENFTGEGMLRLPDNMVTELAAEGLSARAIAAATGRSKSAVGRHVREVTRPDNVISIDGARRPAKTTRTREQAKAAHPAGKAQFATWEMVVFVVADAGEQGATYIDACAALGWRDGKVTGGLSEGSRRGKITTAGVRDGNAVWIAVAQ